MEAADEVTAASLAESLATIAAADEVAAEATGEAEARVRAASITIAEAQVLRYLAKPLPFSVIADKLGISRSAAKERAAPSLQAARRPQPGRGGQPGPLPRPPPRLITGLGRSREQWHGACGRTQLRRFRLNASSASSSRVPP